MTSPPLGRSKGDVAGRFRTTPCSVPAFSCESPVYGRCARHTERASGVTASSEAVYVCLYNLPFACLSSDSRPSARPCKTVPVRFCDVEHDAVNIERSRPEKHLTSFCKHTVIFTVNTQNVRRNADSTVPCTMHEADVL